MNYKKILLFILAIPLMFFVGFVGVSCFAYIFCFAPFLLFINALFNGSDLEVLGTFIFMIGPCFIFLIKKLDDFFECDIVEVGLYGGVFQSMFIMLISGIVSRFI